MNTTTSSSFHTVPSVRSHVSWLRRFLNWAVVPAEQRGGADAGIAPELPAGVFLRDAKPPRDREL